MSDLIPSKVSMIFKIKYEKVMEVRDTYRKPGSANEDLHTRMLGGQMDPYHVIDERDECVNNVSWQCECENGDKRGRSQLKKDGGGSAKISVLLRPSTKNLTTFCTGQST